MPFKWRFALDGLEEKVSAETAIDFSDDPGLTLQSGKDDADINMLMKRFGVTGQMPAPNLQPFTGDFLDVPDYQTALNQIREAEAAFGAMPAELRNHFQNDPAQLWSYLHNPDLNLEEARELGLINALEAPPAPQRVEIVNPPSSSGGTPPAGGQG